jgi:hypothetical protein
VEGISPIALIANEDRGSVFRCGLNWLPHVASPVVVYSFSGALEVCTKIVVENRLVDPPFAVFEHVQPPMLLAVLQRHLIEPLKVFIKRFLV